ncbi:MAG: LamG-like jellyroll fold domain-containing protein [Bacteroidales bacterium]|jgi:hypothetical protein|nr:LamG-like jellyroll fold domain-containing protein [Bacteroidales bacterium]
MKRIILFLIIVSTLHPLFGQTFGNAVDLDGIDDYAVVQHHPSLNPMDGSWSVAFWLNAADIPQMAPVVMKRFPEPGFTMYAFGFGNIDPHNPELGKRIRVNYIEDAGITERSGYTPDEYIDGYWHHYVIVADKIQNGVVIYIDGQEVEFTHMYNLGNWPTIENENVVYIANSSFGSTIQGILDELSIWNKALSITQVQQMMYDTLSSEYYQSADSGLVAYYRFDEFEDLGTGNAGSDDFRDLSFYGNHADSEGNPVLIPSGIFVGMEEKPGNEKALLYPNPASSIVNLQLPSKAFGACQQSVVLEIYDLNGRKLLEKHFSKGTKEIEVDVGNLESGIYFCMIISEKGNATKKLIIQK